GCGITAGDCGDPDFFLTHNDRLDPAPLSVYEPHVIRDLLPAKLRAAYLAIHDRAPNARILVGGYPKLFDLYDGNPHDRGGCAAFSRADWALLNWFADLLNDAIRSTVVELQQQQIQIEFVDVDPAFLGHRACPQTSQSAIQAALPMDSGRFHPNSLGQAIYTSQFQGRL